MTKVKNSKLKKTGRKKTSIKIAHLHVWDQNNKGDYAIVLAVQELLRKNFPGCQIIDFPVNVLKEGTLREAKKINQADFVVIGGGGIFYSYFLPYNKDFIKSLIKPLVIFGAGYIKEVDAPELKAVAAKSVAFLAKQARLVGVRDYNTKKFLVKNGVPLKKVEVIGDPAALLSEKKPRKRIVSQKPVPKIGLNLNYSGWLGFGKWREDILSAYQKTASYFQKELGAEIYYLKHHPGEDQIYPELKIPNLKVVDLPPTAQKQVYGELDLIIGMMLHVGVMAFGAGTPEISVAYDLRNYSFADFIGHPELVVDLAKLKTGALLKQAKKVFKRRAWYQKEFAKIKMEISKQQNSFLKCDII